VRWYGWENGLGMQTGTPMTCLDRLESFLPVWTRGLGDEKIPWFSNRPTKQLMVLIRPDG
jgi:hypothetical protein